MTLKTPLASEQPTPLNVEQIYIKFNQIVLDLFLKKAKFASIDKNLAEDIEGYNKNLAQLLQKNFEANISPQLVQNWLQLFFNNLENIRVYSSEYSIQRKDISNKIKESFSIYHSFFDTYRTQFLPLQEKENLEYHIDKGQDKERTLKI